MNRKKSLVLAFTAVLAASVCSLTGCNFFFNPADDTFPYDAAVENGYTGSEASWLASQEASVTRERRLYEEAKADGYTGSFVEFLKETGVSGDSAVVNRALTSVVAIRTELYAGSGVIYSLDTSTGEAIIITNYHVIYGTNSVSRNISAYLYGGMSETRAISATFLGGSIEYDIALLRVVGSKVLHETENNPVYAAPVSFGDSDCVTVGEKVYALGNPDGQGFSAIGGMVSVDSEYVNVKRADNSGESVKLPEIRFDGPVNHGNSGGGLFDAEGNLVGIVNARSEKAGVYGFGYALPSNFVSAVVRNILDNYERSHGAVRIASLGMTVKQEDGKGVFNEEDGKYYIEEKLIVSGTKTGGIASNSGLKYGDTIIAATLRQEAGDLPKKYITRLIRFTDLLLDIRTGDTLVLEVSRGGRLMEVSLHFNSSQYFTEMG